MQVFRRTSSRSAIALGPVALVLLSPVLLVWWLTKFCFMVLVFAITAILRVLRWAVCSIQRSLTP